MLPSLIGGASATIDELTVGYKNFMFALTVFSNWVPSPSAGGDEEDRPATAVTGTHPSFLLVPRKSKIRLREPDFSILSLQLQN